MPPPNAIVQRMDEKLKMTGRRCPICRGTGASNPDAGDSMDWRDYLPCFACRGTGFVLIKAEEPSAPPAAGDH